MSETNLARRNILLGLAAAPLAACATRGPGTTVRGAAAAAAVPTLTPTLPSGPGTVAAQGMAAYSTSGPLERMRFQRRALGPKDVAIKLHYCGVCHSDIHTVRGDWGPIPYRNRPDRSPLSRRPAPSCCWGIRDVRAVRAHGLAHASTGTNPHRDRRLWLPSAVGRSREVIRPGDVITVGPDEKHWHGASATTAMTHIAIQEALDGKMVEWLEKVTDEQYRGEDQ
jgi:hypothetical protein